MEYLRIYSREYIIKAIAKGKACGEIKEKVGNILLDIYCNYYYQNVVSNQSQKICDFNTGFMFFLDLVNIYLLDFVILQKRENVKEHIDVLNEKMNNYGRYLLIYIKHIEKNNLI